MSMPSVTDFSDDLFSLSDLKIVTYSFIGSITIVTLLYVIL